MAQEQLEVGRVEGSFFFLSIYPRHILFMRHQTKVSLARLEQVPNRDLQQSHIQPNSVSVTV